MPSARIDQLLLAVGAALLLVLCGIGWLLVTDDANSGSEPSVQLEEVGTRGEVVDGARVAEPAPTAATSIVVDVEGAVLRPGIYHLLPGARVGDAIAAAGGYDSTVDLDLAAQELNLAALLSDGEKIVVPRTGASSGGDGGGDADGTDGDGGGDGGDGLVNVNTATAAELEELPGIGPVTAEKIISAREESPFSSLDEMVERGAINRGQLEKIAELAFAG